MIFKFIAFSRLFCSSLCKTHGKELTVLINCRPVCNGLFELINEFMTILSNVFKNILLICENLLLSLLSSLLVKSYRSEFVGRRRM